MKSKMEKYEHTHKRAGLFTSLLSAEKPAPNKREPAPDAGMLSRLIDISLISYVFQARNENMF
jgi:hypothetical protein